jgi:hypothetical protein
LKIAREKYSANNIEFLEGAAEEPPLQRFETASSIGARIKIKSSSKLLPGGRKFGFVIPVDFDTTEQFFTAANMSISMSMS